MSGTDIAYAATPGWDPNAPPEEEEEEEWEEVEEGEEGEEEEEGEEGEEEEGEGEEEEEEEEEGERMPLAAAVEVALPYAPTPLARLCPCYGATPSLCHTW
eukprot:2194541-Rhodomonas_salina.4